MDRIRIYSFSEREKRGVVGAVSALLERRPEIIFAYLHGSFNDSGPFRDLDIAVYLRPNALPASPFHYEDRLAQEISTELNLSVPVDVRLLNGAPVSFQYRVFQGRLLVDGDPEIRAEQSAYVAARYLDIEPILRHHAKEAFKDETR